MDPISISTDPDWLLAGMTVAGEPLDPHHVSIGESIEHFTSVLQGAFRQIMGDMHDWPGVTITTAFPANESLAVRIAIHEVRRAPGQWLTLRTGAPFDVRFIRYGEWPGTPR